MAAKKFWVLETNNPSDASTEVTLYEDKTEALETAVAIAVQYMEDNGADEPDKTYPDWYEQYQDILAAQTCANYFECLRLYGEWNSNHDCYETVFNIYVFPKEVIPKGSSPNWNPSNPPIDTTCVVVPEINNQVKTNVPCRCCQTSLEPGESPCWKCGSENSTIGV